MDEFGWRCFTNLPECLTSVDIISTKVKHKVAYVVRDIHLYLNLGFYYAYIIEANFDNSGPP